MPIGALCWCGALLGPSFERVLRCGLVFGPWTDVFRGCEVVIKSRAASNHETESKVSQVSQVVVAEAVLQDSHVADAVQL